MTITNDFITTFIIFHQSVVSCKTIENLIKEISSSYFSNIIFHEGAMVKARTTLNEN